jgi:CRISPR-associated protein (TIGR03984 family)
MPDSELGLPVDVGPKPLALLQGYPVTCFVRVTQAGRLEIPPAFRSLALDANGELRWDLFWDLRVFGGSAEHHAWKTANSKWRHRRLGCPPPNDTNHIERFYPVWGSRSRSLDGWVLYSEPRGADVWVPEEFAASRQLGLKVMQIIGQPEIPENRDDLNSGIATVVDAMIVSLEGRPKNE